MSKIDENIKEARKEINLSKEAMAALVSDGKEAERVMKNLLNQVMPVDYEVSMGISLKGEFDQFDLELFKLIDRKEKQAICRFEIESGSWEGPRFPYDVINLLARKNYNKSKFFIKYKFDKKEGTLSGYILYNPPMVALVEAGRIQKRSVSQYKIANTTNDVYVLTPEKIKLFKRLNHLFIFNKDNFHEIIDFLKSKGVIGD